MDTDSTKWLTLKSGSDIRGQEDQLTDEISGRIGYAYACALSKLLDKTTDRLTIAVGCDTRPSGLRIKRALTRGITAADCDVIDAGFCVLPALFKCTALDQTADGAVMVTGGDAPIAVQSMCNIPFSRLDELKEQALRLQQAGCDILRVSVPDADSAKGFTKLKACLSIPLVADIHFDYRLAIAAMEAGADKIRINPGNTGKEHLDEIVRVARAHRVEEIERELARRARERAKAAAEAAKKSDKS